MLEAEQVAQAYARWIADGDPDFQAMMSPDLHDHVSGATGPQTWDTVWGWIKQSFGERRVELHGWGTLDDDRIAVWVTARDAHRQRNALARGPAAERRPDRLEATPRLRRGRRSADRALGRA
jgi:hypothetical protein